MTSMSRNPTRLASTTSSATSCCRSFWRSPARALGTSATTVPTPGCTSSQRSWIRCWTTLCAVLGWIFRPAASARTEGKGWPVLYSPLRNAFCAANTTWSKMDCPGRRMSPNGVTCVVLHTGLRCQETRHPGRLRPSGFLGRPLRGNLAGGFERRLLPIRDALGAAAAIYSTRTASDGGRRPARSAGRSPPSSDVVSAHTSPSNHSAGDTRSLNARREGQPTYLMVHRVVQA